MAYDLDLFLSVANSPHPHVGHIRTPMLVVHGEQDHRVPVGEALGLWTGLVRHGVEAKFLHFPDENHWVLKPQHVRIWYETVLAWLDHYVLGRAWVRPASSSPRPRRQDGHMVPSDGTRRSTR